MRESKLLIFLDRVLQKTKSIFLTILGVFTYFNIANQPNVNHFSPLKKLNILSKRNFWSKKYSALGVLRFRLGLNNQVGT